MAEKKAKTFKKGDVVLVCEKDHVELDRHNRKVVSKRQFKVVAGVFSSVDFYGVKVLDGEEYYIAKAIERGAEK